MKLRRLLAKRGFEIVDVFLDEGRPLTGRRRLGAQAAANAARRGRGGEVAARRKA